MTDKQLTIEEKVKQIKQTIQCKTIADKKMLDILLDDLIYYKKEHDLEMRRMQSIMKNPLTRY